MPAYSFQPQFIVPILAGTKTQTIRNNRVRVFSVFENLE